jgi:hypothetical protein
MLTCGTWQNETISRRYRKTRRGEEEKKGKRKRKSGTWCRRIDQREARYSICWWEPLEVSDISRPLLTSRPSHPATQLLSKKLMHYFN